jgi:hypothetical protein
LYGFRRTTMPKVQDTIEATEAPEDRHRAPVLSKRWLKNAMVANRTAFELEMRRERRRLLDSRFDAFWKEVSARQA